MWIISTLQESPVLFFPSVAIVGAIVGSFLNVVIVRLPGVLERSWKQQCRDLLGLASDGDTPPQPGLARPGSHCPQCKHPIRPVHNIPILSYLWLRGRCARCGKSIDLRYPVVETLAAILALAVGWRYGLSWQLAGGLAFAWSFLAMSAIDIEHRLLPDNIVLPLLWAGLMVNSFGLYTDVYSALYGAVAGYVSLWLVFQVFRLLTGKEGMGYGDFKLFACIGAWLGWQDLPLVILLAAFCGAFVGIAMILLKQRDRSQPIPFGPFLCAAGFVAMIWGPQITAAYLQFA
ncbi:MAG: Type 4 prepilin-like proteins leader peptide-processing enzyme [Gammaproteobacteria bacterium]|nr:Type 4 prepilin-like proteins leader peptide-processing enzyme [Gammaproteobacteria bacterium]